MSSKLPLKRIAALCVVWLPAIWAIGATAVHAREMEDAATETQCHWAFGEVQIDGQAEEPDWQSAPWITSFGLPWLREQTRQPPTSTRAKLIWDREALYFFAEMEDADLYADVTAHDGRTWSNDVFELFFKPDNDEPGYYEFQVNAAGTVMDMFLPRRGAGGYDRFKADGEFHLETKVVRRGTLNDWTDRDEGWSVEGRIRWIDFLRTGGRPKPLDQWRFTLCRYDYSVDFEGPALSTTAPRASEPRPDFHRYEDYGTLCFLGPGETKTARAEKLGLKQFVPAITSRVVGAPDPPPPYRAVRAFADLHIDFPMTVVRQPGTDRLIVISSDRPYGATRLWRFADSAEVTEAEILFDLAETAYGLTFHPDFADNRFVFIGCNGQGDTDSAQKYTKVLRYTFNGDAPGSIDPESRRLIIEWPSDGHNGGDLTFGHDRMLYVTSGDGTGDSDTDLRGQGLDHLLAKVLRIDVDHPGPGRAYSVPTDNPFVGREGARPETWAYGLRNPWRITTDRETGHIWVGTNGQDLWEQAYLLDRGANYGWSVYEGSHIFYANRKMGPTPLVQPTVEHSHSEARSLTGGVVYYGERYPELRGAYIYGDYSTGKIWAVKHDGQRVLEHREIADTSLQITGFGADSRRELLIADHRGGGEGGLYRLEPNPSDGDHEAFPRKLSKTGLFRSVATHQLEPALIPYSVNAPLWSDGAYKDRYIALPDADSKIDVTPTRGWNFPDRTVLVKSFAIDMREGDADSRRWIETRLLTRQQGEWVGYSYAWNEKGTDAVLVASDGADREFQIQSGDGTRPQGWHFPSRAECMVCHTRAANYVLGLTTLQMNKSHDYDGAVENQLEVLERLGVLRIDYRGPARAAVEAEARARGMNDNEVSAYVRRQTASRAQPAAVFSPLWYQPPQEYDALVDPYDAKNDLAKRARSYLHGNCSMCHVAAGGGNAQIDLEFTTSLEGMKAVDVPPLHHTFEINDARVISAGTPERSVMLHRMALRGHGQMPQLATSLVDVEAVELVQDWIASLPTDDAGTDGSE